MSRFVAGMMMAVGLLIALTTGLCSLTFTAMFILTKASIGPETSIIIAYIVIGLVISAFGVWLFRRGLARLRRG